MKLFKTFTLTWWQAAIFKLCVVSLGIFIGSMWPQFFRSWEPGLVLIYLVAGFYLLAVWWKQ